MTSTSKTYAIEPDGSLVIDDIPAGANVTISAGQSTGVNSRTHGGVNEAVGSITDSDGYKDLSFVFSGSWEAIIVTDWSMSGGNIVISYDIEAVDPPFKPPSYGGSAFDRPKLTALMLGGIEIPASADTDIRCSMRLISAASDLRRTVNADLISVARSAFQKYEVAISGSGLRPAAVSGLAPGEYVEVVPPEPLAVSLRVPSTSVELPRPGMNAVGITADGRKLPPLEPLPSPLPLSAAFDAARIDVMRARPVVSFSEAVAMVRYRAAFACAVVEWSIDHDERLASGSWSLTLEEV